MDRSAAVTVPAPLQAPNRMTGFLFRTLLPKRSATMWGVTATTRPTKSRLVAQSGGAIDESRACAEADDADEDREADRVEDPEGRLGNPAERRPREQAEDEPHR